MVYTFTTNVIRPSVKDGEIEPHPEHFFNIKRMQHELSTVSHVGGLIQLKLHAASNRFYSVWQQLLLMSFQTMYITQKEEFDRFFFGGGGYQFLMLKVMMLRWPTLLPYYGFSLTAIPVNSY